MSRVHYIDPRRKILRYPEILAKIKGGQKVWPINVEMDLANFCNLKCTWCDFVYMHDQTYMDYDLACKILRELALLGIRSITFTGGGEPTLNPDFARIAEIAHTSGLHLGLYTNGVEVGQLLSVLNCFDWIYVSLDASSQETFLRLKGVDAFHKILDNIATLRHCTTSTIVGVGFLLCGGNWHSVSEAVDITRGAVDYVQFRPVVGDVDYSWVTEALTLLSKYDDCGWIIYSPERFLELLDNSLGVWVRGYSICRGSELVPCIGASGEVWVCPNTRSLRKLGDLKDESFEQIWLRRAQQCVDVGCRVSCRNHYLNQTLEYVCSNGVHRGFV